MGDESFKDRGEEENVLRQRARHWDGGGAKERSVIGFVFPGFRVSRNRKTRKNPEKPETNFTTY